MKRGRRPDREREAAPPVLKEGKLRTAEGVEAKKLRERARLRAVRAVARNHPEEYRRTFALELLKVGLRKVKI